MDASAEQALHAKIDTEVAEKEFSRQLQLHLIEVARAYWGLYLERATLLQKLRSVHRAKQILKQLQDRETIDAIASQIQRAEAEVATRKADVIRSKMAVENAEAKIRSLVNDPGLGDNEAASELIPMDIPTEMAVACDLSASLTQALQNRPEVAQAIKQIRAAGVRAEMTKNELLPVLNLVTESYVAGLQNSGSIGDAFTDQFHVGSPSFAVGLKFEAPLGNRAARSRHERRLLEMRQLRHQYQTTVQTLSLEVEVAVREMETSYNEMLAQQQAMNAGHAQLQSLEKRWELLPGENGNSALMLENLLNAQDRVVHTEGAFVQAWVTYNLALINHRRATGDLLRHHDISWNDYIHACEGVKSRQLTMPGANAEQSIVPGPSIEPEAVPETNDEDHHLPPVPSQRSAAIPRKFPAELRTTNQR